LLAKPHYNSDYNLKILLNLSIDKSTHHFMGFDNIDHFHRNGDCIIKINPVSVNPSIGSNPDKVCVIQGTLLP